MLNVTFQMKITASPAGSGSQQETFSELMLMWRELTAASIES